MSTISTDSLSPETAELVDKLVRLLKAGEISEHLRQLMFKESELYRHAYETLCRKYGEQILTPSQTEKENNTNA